MKHYTNRTAIKKPPEVALRILRLTQKKLPAMVIGHVLLIYPIPQHTLHAV